MIYVPFINKTFQTSNVFLSLVLNVTEEILIMTKNQFNSWTRKLIYLENKESLRAFQCIMFSYSFIWFSSLLASKKQTPSRDTKHHISYKWQMPTIKHNVIKGEVFEGYFLYNNVVTYPQMKLDEPQTDLSLQTHNVYTVQFMFDNFLWEEKYLNKRRMNNIKGLSYSVLKC